MSLLIPNAVPMNIMRANFMGALTVFMLVAAQPCVRAQGSAQQCSLKEPLTLEQCIAIAIGRHGNAISAKANYEAIKAQVNLAKAPLMPKFTTEHTFFRGQTLGRQAGFILRRLGETTETKQSLLSFGIQLDSGLTVTQIEQARALANASWEEFETALGNVALNVTEAYFELLRSQRILKLNEQRLEAANEHMRMVEARIKVGDAAPVDIYPVRVELANARLNLLAAQNAVTVARLKLSNAMGVEETNFEIEDVPEPQLTTAPLQELIEMALKEHPEVQRLRWQLEAAKASVKYERLQSFPVLNITAGYDVGIGGYSATERQWQINANVQFPIFDGGLTAARIESAKSKMKATQASYEQLLKDIRANVGRSYLDMLNAWERIGASKVVVDEAEQNLKAAMEKYRLGLGIVLEVVDAQVGLFNAHVSLIQSIYDYYIAKARLEHATGELAKRCWNILRAKSAVGGNKR
ncbi:MAG: TolC family protein [Armatimonadota bacterium]|nr:TolC family protein [Armatimonadota bacterium]MCX7776785.1 TolC family protein [Armatimonadota bacterium]MDW8024582.1 TolC family protein [Armatimonadota bacterium]